MPMQVNVEGRGERMNLVRNKRCTGAQAFGAEGKKSGPEGTATPEERRWGHPVSKNKDMAVWIHMSLIRQIGVEV
jgi:hypothetical protein